MKMKSRVLEQVDALRSFNNVLLHNDKQVVKTIDIIEKYLIKAQEQEKVLEILKKGYFSTAYNPEGDYHHITFDVYGEEDYKKINEMLKEGRIIVNINE